MSAAVSRQDNAGRLLDLLTPKSGPGSPQVRRSGSFRRSRNSPSTSPSIAAERELSAFLGMTSLNSKTGLEQERKVPSASAQLPVFLNQQPQKGDVALRTDTPYPQTSTQDTNHATTSYLSNNSSQAQRDTLRSSHVVIPTSNINQHSDHNNSGNDLPGYREVQPAESCPTEGLVENISGENSEEKLEHSGATTGSMSVVLEKCSLVPQLKAFHIISESPYSSRRHHHGRDQDDLVITNLEEPVEQIQNELNNNTEGGHVQMLPSPRKENEEIEEEEENEDKVMVWCVTGVCEIAADLSHSENVDAQTTNEQPRGHNQGSTGRTPPDTPAQENVVPVPISNQPVPSASHFDDASGPASSSGQCSAEPASEPDGGLTPTMGTFAGVANQDTAVSTRKTSERDAVTVQSVIPGPKASSSNRGAKSSAPPRTIKESPTSKTQQTAIKTANSAPAGNKSRAVRTLTTSENQGMRRVVPISRSSRGAPSQGKHLEKPPGSHRGSSGATTSSSSSSSAWHRRGERPSTAPSSRRSSFNKVLDTKDSKEPKVSGVQSHNQDWRKASSVRKPPAKPVVKPEEKMCRSTLRALTQGDGGSGSISAPTTPMHKAAVTSTLPGFARSTASFSFRRTQTTLSTSKAASDSSSKPLPSKNITSSVAPRSRAGSLRVSQSSHFQSSSSPGPNSRPQSNRAPVQSRHPDLLVIPKGHRRTDSGTLLDNSTHSQLESVKSIKPSWR